MKVIFAGGGTGGHIYPAISIANYIKENEDDFEALFIGTKHGLETKLVPSAGYSIEYIDIEGFDRKHMLKNIKILKKIVSSTKRCEQIIDEFKPDCVVCTGGYVSGPAAMAAKKKHIPSFIHEQNVYPGLTVKMAIKHVDYVAVSFSETVDYIADKSKCVVTGNPIRNEILKSDKAISRKKLGLDDKPFVLIFGGSLGAQKINDAVIDMLKDVIKDNKIRLLFATGERNHSKVCEILEERKIKQTDDVKVVSYINDMDVVMAACDLVVSRSGAITLSELMALHKPSILIPSPNVVRNHQEQNARAVEASGGAFVISEDELTGEKLYSTIIRLSSDSAKLEKMSQCLQKIAKPDALIKLYELIKKMTRKDGGSKNEH